MLIEQGRKDGGNLRWICNDLRDFFGDLRDVGRDFIVHHGGIINEHAAVPEIAIFPDVLLCRLEIGFFAE